ncbi:hypothetical protein Lepto7376_3631 [[Leptolyngbya] sp. PCC 7376]|uniref:DUF3131 domain-containing protein n=1 Tax=[Leptolyngbya] sp. PCC 7376 TaxID=111781 RepID=UPI00029EF484|nr:DUF3131 domain-containing protein [[Leptolyngbya] sp. PCC 7376]AFY39811.1 hypothetical protein Lepto7376_3631 [[Leptolyngbya] sp. PCC 7376]
MNFFKYISRKSLISLCLGSLSFNTLIACTQTPAPIALQEEEEVSPVAAEETELSNAICGDLQSPLTQKEQVYATAAWQYFVNNYQSETGFTNAADQFPSGTLWDQGNYLMALNAVRWFGMIDQATFDVQLNQFLNTLGELPLVDNALPNKVYNSATAEMVDYGNQPTTEGIGWSALDLGRLLTSLHIIRSCHPQYEDWISGIISSWQLPRSIKDGQLYGAAITEDGSITLLQEGRLGYEEYAARGYELWGFQVEEAIALEPMEMVTISGIEIPVDSRDYESTNANNYVVSESYILEAIEFGWDETMAQHAESLFQAQENRYQETGFLTAVSEDNIDQAPHFLYSTLFANGEPWAVITEDNEPYPQLRTLSTKAAFGWYYLFPKKTYSLELIKATQNLQDPNGDGFYAGIYEETGNINTILTGNTNGLILEILYYKALGNQSILQRLNTAQTPKESES